MALVHFNVLVRGVHADTVLTQRNTFHVRSSQP